ncbi:MAG: 30S ribosomal protein S8 [Dehalococcoidales bacterium]|jgi:small subunit ribosomal protein S8|nr:30S ribosomal protein S8 [Dehalococcoidales bacterium]MDD3264476.1 30S ribosomal protein S8 [Dehalococcoidales bacterium]MDD4322007.1 30S ribosomal protein S8 [Dehalococcoidales bacterium]MDD4793900.1 30S ribosomal protein S8 [Dehalococcoidales bacterium]MDD5122094.1 30S ribosomal protein S8 [Dehalococcoidales bacterium]
MTVSDPISDMLTRIRNANMVQHENVAIPASKMKVAIAKILKDEGFITDYNVEGEKVSQRINITLKYDNVRRPFINGLKRVSKPGLRVYVPSTQIPKVYGGAGIAVVSTSRGVMTGREAYRKRVGGELLGFIW